MSEDPLDHYRNYTSPGSSADIEAELQWKARHFSDHFLEHLPNDHSASIFDVGCGSGVYIARLIHHGYQCVHGVDASEAQISFARNRFGLTTQASVGDATKVLPRDRSISCILAIDVLEHLGLADLVALLDSAYSSLVAAGILLVQVPNSASPLNPHVLDDYTHQRLFTPRSLRQALLGAGFETVDIYPVFPPSVGVKGVFRTFLWRAIVGPGIRFCGALLHGAVRDPIVTGNILAVARRS